MAARPDPPWLTAALADGATVTGVNMAAFEEAKPSPPISERPGNGPAATLTADGWFPVPIPPSANAIWRAVRKNNGRQCVIKSKSYRLWLNATVDLMRVMPAASGPVMVMIRAGGKGFNRQRDLDNVIKPVIDCLRHAGRIDGDTVKTVVSIVATYLPDGLPRCEVKVVSVAARPAA